MKNVKQDFIQDYKIKDDLKPADVLKSIRSLRRMEDQAKLEIQLDEINSLLSDTLADIKKEEAERYNAAYKAAMTKAAELEAKSIANIQKNMAEMEAEEEDRKASWNQAAADIEFALAEEGFLSETEKSRINDARKEYEEIKQKSEEKKEEFALSVEDNVNMPEKVVERVIALVTEYTNVRADKFPTVFAEA